MKLVTGSNLFCSVCLKENNNRKKKKRKYIDHVWHMILIINNLFTLYENFLSLEKLDILINIRININIIFEQIAVFSFKLI